MSSTQRIDELERKVQKLSAVLDSLLVRLHAHPVLSAEEVETLRWELADPPTTT